MMMMITDSKTKLSKMMITDSTAELTLHNYKFLCILLIGFLLFWGSGNLLSICVNDLQREDFQMIVESTLWENKYKTASIISLLSTKHIIGKSIQDMKHTNA